MNVLLTGATGFLGSYVAEALSEAGHTARCLVRKTSDTSHLKKVARVELVSGSVEDAASVRAATEGCEGVIHVAGVVKARDEAEFFEVNVRGTENVLAAAEACGVKRLVHVSSLTVAGPSRDGRPVSKESREPLTAYGRSKAAAEDRVLADKGKLHVVVLRPPMIYGPRDRESFAFFESVKNRLLPFIGDGTNTLSVIYGSDCASACVAALTADVPSGSVYFVDDGEIYVWKDMLAEIERAMDKRAFVRLSLPIPLVRAAATLSELSGKVRGKAVMLNRDKLNELTAPHWVCDSSDTRAELGWQPKVKWAEGVRRAAEWYRREGWL